MVYLSPTNHRLEVAECLGILGSLVRQVAGHELREVDRLRDEFRGQFQVRDVEDIQCAFSGDLSRSGRLDHRDPGMELLFSDFVAPDDERCPAFLAEVAGELVSMG